MIRLNQCQQPRYHSKITVGQRLSQAIGLLAFASCSAIFVMESTVSIASAQPTTVSVGDGFGVQPITVVGDPKNLAVGGWRSGASGDMASNGKFGTWRGKPLQVASTWDDGPEQASMASLNTNYSDFLGDLDIAVGGVILTTKDFQSTESYAEAASGAYVARWRQQAETIKTVRTGKPGKTYLRFCHEFNGNWYKEWNVNSGNVNDYKKAFQLWASTVRKVYPDVLITWGANNGTHSDISIESMWPGDDYIDVVGVDVYDANGITPVTDVTLWDGVANQKAGDGSPVGVESWRKFAEAHGKPMALPEWGLNPGEGGGNHPVFIKSMHDWIASHAAQPGQPVAGRVIYDVYYNIKNNEYNNFSIYGYGENPNAAEQYKALDWGTAGEVQVPGPISESEMIPDIPYTTGQQHDKQKLDLYLPARGDTAVPLVIYIHGGGFFQGDKHDVDLTREQVVKGLVPKGYAVASLNYRLSGDALFPAGVQDVKAAVRWLRANASQYGIDPNRFAAWGTSAGAYMATMIGVTAGQGGDLSDPSLGNEDASDAVKAVVDWYGPTDFRAMDTQAIEAGCGNPGTHDDVNSPESRWLGIAVQESPLWEESNPVGWIKKVPANQLPPFLIRHGSKDCTVAPGQSKALADAIGSDGITSPDFAILQDKDHNFDPLENEAWEPTVAFLDKHLAASSPDLPDPVTSNPSPAPTPTPLPEPPAQKAGLETGWSLTEGVSEFIDGNCSDTIHLAPGLHSQVCIERTDVAGDELGTFQALAIFTVRGTETHVVDAKLETYVNRGETSSGGRCGSKEVKPGESIACVGEPFSVKVGDNAKTFLKMSPAEKEAQAYKRFF